MFIDRTQLASVAYWRTSAEGPPQRFYVMFCLLTSAIQDLLLALKEQETHNLNWSATCSYYSLVHAGRLISFAALGDFPQSHATLRKLLSESHIDRLDGHSPEGTYPFDWLAGFSAESHRTSSGPEDFRPVVLAYLNEIGVVAASEKLQRFGRILAAAAPLRNDSNYEALLITHEYQHETMTSAFYQLAEAMVRAADSSIPFVIEIFNRFFENDPDLPSDRGEYESLLHDYLSDRIIEAIKAKLGGSASLIDKLQDVVANIRVPPVSVPYNRLENAISRNVFGPKARLMSGFQSKIHGLAAIVGRDRQ